MLLGAFALIACDDDTAMVGYDVIPKKDEVSAIDSVFTVSSRTIKVDSVLSNTSTCYLGSIVDPDMHIKTTSGFLAQFYLPANFKLPAESKLALSPIKADSCDLRLYIDSYYGDSLTTMKLHVQELEGGDKALNDNTNYYTDLRADDYIKQGGVSKTISYAVKDLTRPDNETNGKTYYRQIVVKLPEDFGTKIMRSYYDDPNSSNFKSSYDFIRNVCAGFSFKSAGGTDVLLKTAKMSLNVYFSYHSKTTAGADTIVGGAVSFGGTEEVLQTTYVDNTYPGSVSNETLAGQPCTYLKSPAGYFTEMTIPVDDVVDGKNKNGEHYNDSINSAQIIIRRKTNEHAEGAFAMPVPQQILLLRKADVTSFFERNKLPDSELSYLSSQTTEAKNYYAFSNIAPLVTYMKVMRDKAAGVLRTDDAAARRSKYAAWEASDKYDADWNKVVLMPVDAVYTQTTSTTGTAVSVLRSVKAQLGLTSVQLEGGADGENPVKMQIIYSRYNK